MTMPIFMCKGGELITWKVKGSKDAPKTSIFISHEFDSKRGGMTWSFMTDGVVEKWSSSRVKLIKVVADYLDENGELL